MNYSKEGLDLTKRFESCRLQAYPDSKGVLTIGWGHTARVHAGMTCTQAEADAWLLGDMAAAEAAVRRAVHVQLTQHQYDALVDFAFNVGAGAFAGSTLARLVNAGDLHGAAAEFERWDKAGGRVVAGLLRRRNDEREEFVK